MTIAIIAAPDTTPCTKCDQLAQRVGTQDALDVYVCPQQHLTRYRVGLPHEPKNRQS